MPNRAHWTDPEKTWVSNSSSSNLQLGVHWDLVPFNFLMDKTSQQMPLKIGVVPNSERIVFFNHQFSGAIYVRFREGICPYWIGSEATHLEHSVHLSRRMIRGHASMEVIMEWHGAPPPKKRWKINGFHYVSPGFVFVTPYKWRYIMSYIWVPAYNWFGGPFWRFGKKHDVRKRRKKETRQLVQTCVVFRASIGGKKKKENETKKHGDVFLGFHWWKKHAKSNQSSSWWFQPIW